MRFWRRGHGYWLVLWFGAAAASGIAADSSGPSGGAGIEKSAAQVLEQYLRDTEGKGRNEGGSAPFEIDASLPKLHKQGMMRGLKLITSAGKVAYTQLHFAGDELIQTAVIARFLKADIQQRASGEDASITARNYRFHYRGTRDYNGRKALVYRTEPKNLRASLFRGELWIDSETARPLREWGEFVKSPSVFLSKIYFVRDYALDGEGTHPRRIILKMRAALVGPVDLTIWLDEERSSLARSVIATAPRDAKG